MNNSKLLAENFIVGATYLVTIVLGYIIIFDNTLDLISEIKSLTTGATLFLAGITYIIGSITMRLLSIVNYSLVKKVIPFRILRFLFSRKDRDIINNWDSDLEGEMYSVVIQFGADAVLRRIDAYESVMRISKALVFTLPFIGLFGAILISINLGIIQQILMILFGLVLSFVSFKTHRITKHAHLGAIIKYYNLLKDEVEKNKTRHNKR